MDVNEFASEIDRLITRRVRQKHKSLDRQREPERWQRLIERERRLVLREIADDERAARRRREG